MCIDEVRVEAHSPSNLLVALSSLQSISEPAQSKLNLQFVFLFAKQLTHRTNLQSRVFVNEALSRNVLVLSVSRRDQRI